MKNVLPSIRGQGEAESTTGEQFSSHDNAGQAV
jgi:hypothetical protein